MRIFIAIEFSKEIKEYIASKQSTVKQHAIKGNFTDLDNLHLTLRFIGDVEENELEGLKKAIDETAEKAEVFQLKLSRLGFFPRGSKKILWIGIEKEYLELQQLVRNLEQALEKHGYRKEDRKYTPHITLGREVLIDEKIEDLNEKAAIESKVIQVTKISLMHSTRVNGRLTYIPIYIKEIQGF